MRTKSFSASATVAQAERPSTHSRAAEHPAVTAASAAHSFVSRRQWLSAKQTRAKRKRMQKHAKNWKRLSKPDRRRAFLQRKGRRDWKQFKEEHPQLAREHVERLKHFESI